MRDLLKAFLTLVAAVLTFSLTLGDKVVAFATATLFTKRLLYAAWSLLMLALVLGGGSLTAFYIAASDIKHGLPVLQGATTLFLAYSAVILAVLAFGVAMGLIMWSVVRPMRAGRL